MRRQILTLAEIHSILQDSDHAAKYCRAAIGRALGKSPLVYSWKNGTSETWRFVFLELVPGCAKEISREALLQLRTLRKGELEMPSEHLAVRVAKQHRYINHQ